MTSTLMIYTSPFINYMPNILYTCPTILSQVSQHLKYKLTLIRIIYNHLNLKLLNLLFDSEVKA